MPLVAARVREMTDRNPFHFHVAQRGKVAMGYQGVPEAISGL